MLPESFYVQDEVQKRDVTLGDGKKHGLHFKSAASRLWRRYYFADPKKDDEEFETAMDAIIVASVVEPDGSPGITVEQVARLRFPVKLAIMRQITEMNDEPGKD